MHIIEISSNGFSSDFTSSIFSVLYSCCNLVSAFCSIVSLSSPFNFSNSLSKFSIVGSVSYSFISFSSGIISIISFSFWAIISSNSSHAGCSISSVSSLKKDSSWYTSVSFFSIMYCFISLTEAKISANVIAISSNILFSLE